MRLFKSLAIAALLAATSASAGAAQFTSTGYIESVNSRANTVRVRDGDEYRFSPSTDLTGFTAGDRVHVGWNSQSPRFVGHSDRQRYQLEAVSIERAE